MTEPRNPGLVVEFFGLPRSGKSTLAHHLAQILKSDGINIEEPTRQYSLLSSPKYRLIEKGKILLRDFRNHPVRCIEYFNLIGKSKQNGMADYLKNVANWSFVNYLLTKPVHPNNIRILDQGMFQAIWSIMLSAQEVRVEVFEDAISDGAPGKHLIVLVNASATSRLARAGGYSRMITNPTKYSHNKAESVYGSINTMARKLCDQIDRLQSITIDNETDNDLDSKALRVKDVIIDMIDS